MKLFQYLRVMKNLITIVLALACATHGQAQPANPPAPPVPTAPGDATSANPADPAAAPDPVDVAQEDAQIIPMADLQLVNMPLEPVSYTHLTLPTKA